MELIVLGSCGTWPSAGGATSGFLVRHDGFDLWLDAGSGTLSRLQSYTPLSSIDACLITHGHPDHFVDLYPAYYARHYFEQGPGKLPLGAPDDFFGRFEQLVSEESRDTVRETYAFAAPTPGEPFELGPFRIEAFEMEHIGVRAFGYRIAVDGVVLAYTGDSGPCEAAVELAHDADLFLCEATWQQHDRLAPFHMSAAQAGEHATLAGAKRLVLTHIMPIHDRERSRIEAAETFDGPIDVATEDARHEVGG
ncbi:MAG: MBL fold metallo-hydrolase [Actinomycetota bacterium]